MGYLSRSRTNSASREWTPSWVRVNTPRVSSETKLTPRPGYAAWIGKPAENDCVLVEILYELGAVPFVRTNVPQTLMVTALLAL